MLDSYEYLSTLTPGDVVFSYFAQYWLRFDETNDGYPITGGMHFVSPGVPLMYLKPTEWYAADSMEIISSALWLVEDKIRIINPLPEIVAFWTDERVYDFLRKYELGLDDIWILVD